jgi:beta-glucosidase
VTNTGRRDSRDVVQVYLDPAETDQPVRLFGWAAVTVAAGHTTRLDVTTDDRLWRRWDTTTGAWARIGDGGRLLLGRGLGDIRATMNL